MDEYRIVGRATNPISGYRITGTAAQPKIEEPSNQQESFLGKLPRNILSGFANLGHGLLNAPHDLAKGLEGGINLTKLMGVPGVVGNGKNLTNYSDYIPTQEEHNFPEMLGQKGTGTLMDNLIQKGTEHLPEILMGGGLLRSGLRAFPLTQRMAGAPLRQAQRLTNERNIPNIQNNNELIERSRPYLDNTRETQRMLDDASAGSHEALFSLQSQLGKEGRSLQKSANASERRIHREPQELKQDILNHMENHLRQHGHDDVADLLRNGVRDYRHYIQIRDNVYPVLKKLGIPTSIFGALVLGKKAVKNVMKN